MPTAAPLPANAACPRCAAGFRCGVADPGACACTTPTLSPALLSRLAHQFPGRCLCLDCLRALQAGDEKAAPAS